MAIKYKAKRPELIDALALAGISTAEKLAEEAGIARGTAQSVFAGREVTLRTAIDVVHRLQASGAEVAVSTAFEEIS